MAENDVGGIGVKFTADAAQLKQELTSLEQRLRAFNEAHGQTKVKLQASLVMPGNRVLQDFRRDIEKSFKEQGAAGPIKARLELLPPTAAQIKTLKGQIGKIEVDVIGNFKWGNKPPKSITVEVVEKGTSVSDKRPAALSTKQASTQAADTQAPARRSAARRASSRVERTTWTQADLDRFSLDALRDQIKGTRGAERSQLQNAINQREREGRTNVGGYTAGGYKASSGPGGGGARGFISDFARQTRQPLPRIADTGTVPLSSGAIRRMQGSGELPLPFARAGLYDPTVKRTSLTAKTMPSEEEIRSRTRQAMSITPRERMEAGERWWPEAARVIAGMGHGTGLKGPQMAGVAAMATNALDWPGTIRVLDKVFSRMRDGAREMEAIFGGTQMTGRDRAKAMDILKSSGTSSAVEGILRGPKGVQAPKVAEMFRGFMGDPNALPMDRHFQALTTGGEIPTSQIRRVREIVASEIRAAGRQPAGTMAGMWETIGGGEPFGPDPWGQLRARGGAPAAFAGGARGFAAPSWLKDKPDKSRRALLDIVMDQVQPTGRPGIHVERGGQLGISGSQFARPQSELYTVARNEAGEPLGALEMSLGGKGHDVRDVMPFVYPNVRGQGIGSSLYAHAQRAGFDVESASDRNAASAINKQTEYGQALWASRKRRMGLDPDKYRQEVREREKIHVPTITFGQRVAEAEPAPLTSSEWDQLAEQNQWGQTGTVRGLTGGARGFAEPLSDDPYQQNKLNEQRRSMREVNAAKADADAARHQAAVEKSNRERRARFENLPEAEKQARYFESNAQYAKPESLGPGGTLPFGNYYAPTHAAVLPERAAIGRRPRATMAQLGATQLGLFGPPEPPAIAHARQQWEQAEVERAKAEKQAAASAAGAFAPAEPAVPQLPPAPRIVTHVTAEGTFHTDAAGRRVAGPPGGGQPPRSAYESPFHGPQPGPGNQEIRAIMSGARLVPGFEDLIDPVTMQPTAKWHEVSQGPRRAEEAAPSGFGPTAFVSPMHARQTTAMMAERFGAFGPGQGPPITAGTPRAASVRDIARPTGVDLNNLETAAYLRRQQLQAAEPTLQEQQEQLEARRAGGGGGGGGGRPPVGPPGAPPDGEDTFGQPQISERLRQFGATGAAGSQRERIQSLLRANREAVQLVRGAGQVRAVGTTTAGIFANIFGGKAERELILQDLTALDGHIKAVHKDGVKMIDALDEAGTQLAVGREAERTGAISTEELEGLQSGYDRAAKAAKPWTDAIGAAEEESARLNKRLNSGKAAAIGFASSIAGTLVGLAAFQAVNVGLEKVVELGKESIDMMSGFTNEAGKVGTALGQTTRQMNGFAEGAVSASFAQAGLGQETADSLRPALEQRAALVAGNSALEDQITLIKAGINTQMQNRLVSQGLAPGPGQNRGSIPGISASTGGWLNSPLFGQTPLIEQLAELGPRGTAGQRAGMTATGGGIGAILGGGIGLALGLLGGPFAGITVPAGVGIGTALGGGLGLAAGSTVLPEMAGLGDLGLDDPNNPGRWQQLQSQLGQTRSVTVASGQPSGFGKGIGVRGGGVVTTQEPILDTGTQIGIARVEALSATIEDLGEAGKRADPAIAGTAHAVTELTQAGGATEVQLQASEKALRSIGVPEDQIESFRAAGIAFEGAALESRKTFQDWWENAAKGLSIPDPKEAVKNMMRPLSAALQQNAFQGQFQRESIIPGQSYLRQLAAGRAGGGGPAPRVNIANPLTAGTAGLPPGVLNMPGIDTSQLTAGLAQVETQGNKGRDALVGMIKTADRMNATAGISSNLLQSFNSLTEAAGKTAATIRSISQASAWMQVNLQVKQINEQIYLMSRSLEDAKSFLSGAGGGELGLLQNRARSLDIAQAELGFRQQSLALANQELGIAASTLQLQQRQRQINFQRAIAGFATPGQTPEEIAARQKEAGLEADFAQKGQDISVEQLDNQKASVELQRESLGISKEQFAVQQAMITVSAERAVGDLGRAIGLLQEQAHVTVQLQVNAEAVEAYQTVLADQMTAIEAVTQEAATTIQTYMNNAAALVATYGGLLTDWNNRLLSGMADYVARAGLIIQGFAAAATVGGYAGRPRTSLDEEASAAGGGAATGFYGSVSGKTQITVGEAGPETVAILRNPRSMTWSGNGGDSGGVNINIMVSGNNVGSEQDADELAATIARKVEETMSRRSSLLGLRPN